MASTNANIHRDPKKSKTYEPLDFAPLPEQEPELLSEEEQMKQLIAMLMPKQPKPGKIILEPR